MTLRETCARIASSNPYMWKLAWEALHWAPFLLPHDKSYNALHHFIALKPNGLFLDVGANDGISTLSFRKFDRRYRIFAVEPNPLLEPHLRRIKRKDASFDYLITAAGSKPSRMTFFVPVYRGIAFHTFTSGDSAEIAVVIGKAFGRRVAAGTQMRMFESNVIALDELNLEPTIVKIDAEGFDFEVLLGLTATIDRARPFMMIEIAPAAFAKITEFVRGRNYALLGYDIAADRFTGDIPASVSLASGYQNFFAVPHEWLHALKMDSDPAA
jgi:FkbM family methyltransferase